MYTIYDFYNIFFAHHAASHMVNNFLMDQNMVGSFSMLYATQRRIIIIIFNSMRSIYNRKKQVHFLGLIKC